MRGIDMCLHVFSCFRVCSSPFESWYNLALIRRNSHKITQSQTFWTIFLHSKLLPVRELWLKLNQFLPLPYTQINWKAITQPHVFNGMGNYLAHDSKDVCPTSKSCPANCSNCWNNQNCQLYDTRKFRVNGKYLLLFLSHSFNCILCVRVCLPRRSWCRLMSEFYEFFIAPIHMQMWVCSSVGIVSRGYYFNFVRATEMPVVDSLIYCLFMIENSKTKINTFRERFAFFLRTRARSLVCVCLFDFFCCSVYLV